MDPLSIAASVGSLTGVCVATVKRLGKVVNNFRDAPQILNLVSSEAKIISVSLSQLQNILLGDADEFPSKALLRSNVRSALDTALIGCTATLLCIEEETRSLVTNLELNQSLGFAEKAKVVWKDGRFKELLEQLKRQYAAIGIMQQGFQMNALADIHRLLNAEREIVQQVATRTESLRNMYPRVAIAKSFLEPTGPFNAALGGTQPAISTLSDRSFDFDDLVTSSRAYRRVLVAATHTLKHTHNQKPIPHDNRVDTHNTQVTSMELEKNLSPESANQSRKITVASQSRTIIAPYQDQPPQKANVVHPNGSDHFVQQLRGYVDQVEEELHKAKNEPMQLRETVRERDLVIQEMNSRLQAAIDEAKCFRLNLEKVQAEKDQSEADFQVKWQEKDKELQKLNSNFSIVSKILQSSEDELQTCKKLRIELESALKLSRSENKEIGLQIQNEQKLRSDTIISYEEKLHDKDSSFKRTEAELRVMSEELIRRREEMDTIVREQSKTKDKNQFLELKLNELVEWANAEAIKWTAVERSVRNGHTTQFGPVLLSSLQSPAWHDEAFKRPHLFEVVNFPEVPEGWNPEWHDGQKKWIYRNRYTNDCVTLKPTVPAVDPSISPQTPKSREANSDSPSQRVSSNGASTSALQHTDSNGKINTIPGRTSSQRVSIAAPHQSDVKELSINMPIDGRGAVIPLQKTDSSIQSTPKQLKNAVDVSMYRPKSMPRLSYSSSTEEIRPSKNVKKKGFLSGARRS